MAQTHNSGEDAVLNDSPFETIFRGNIGWTSIFVKPVFKQPEFIHYKIILLDGSSVYVWKTSEGTWEECTGNTERSQLYGNAIDMHYLGS